MDVESRGRPPSTARDHHDRIDHGQMPARARHLIDAVCTLCDQWIEPTLRLCLDRFDKRLYEQAESSRNHLEQQRCFDSRNLTQQGRTAFMQSFSLHLRDSFEHMGRIEGDDAHEPLGLQSLTLLDRTEHELTAALDKLAARNEAHNGPVLSELSYRLAVLVGSAPLEGKDLPPGPQSLAQLLRAASEPLNLPIEHRLILLQVFETSVGAALTSLYEGINAKLVADGILPQLRAFPASRPTHGPAHGATPSAVPATAAPPAAATTEQRSEPIAVLETLRDLLSRQRDAYAGPAPTAGGRTATPDELQTALSALQQHVAQVTDQTSRELRSAQLLHEELLLQLNAGLPPGTARMQLSTEQGDTVELVTMLFEQLAQQLHHGQDARALLGNLQLPMLRLAVTDRDFFNQREHPARQVLGKLAETVQRLGSTDPTAKPIISCWPNLANWSNAPNTNRPAPASIPACWQTSNITSANWRAKRKRRSAVTSKRLQGHERLEQARRRADELMNERFAVASPRGLLRTLLERAWTDVLALNLLRHGENSDPFRQQLRITDQLLGQFPVNDPVLLRARSGDGPAADRHACR